MNKTLYIDIGNTNIKLISQKKIKMISTDSSEKDIEIIFDKFINNMDLVILSSVVEKVSSFVKQLINKKGKKLYDFNTSEYHKIMNVDKGELKSMGADRMLVIAASNLQRNNIIVDLGTALTIDVLRGTEYLTGYIHPGIDLLFNSLFIGTEALPKFSLEKIDIQRENMTTESQVVSGVVLGIIGSINKMIETILQNYNKEEFKIILVGNGFLKLIELLGEKNLLDLFSFKCKLEYDLNIKGFEYLEKMIQGEDSE